MSFDRLLEIYFDGYTYMCKRYPKAAKKLRIRKKWKKRFGTGFNDTIRDCLVFGKGFATIDSYTKIWHEPIILENVVISKSMTLTD